MLNIINYKITPQQLAEIEGHLELASWMLNSEEIPNWEDLQTACRNIWDAREDLKMIREKAEKAITNPDAENLYFERFWLKTSGI